METSDRAASTQAAVCKENLVNRVRRLAQRCCSSVCVSHALLFSVAVNEQPCLLPSLAATTYQCHPRRRRRECMPLEPTAEPKACLAFASLTRSVCEGRGSSCAPMGGTQWAARRVWL